MDEGLGYQDVRYTHTGNAYRHTSYIKRELLVKRNASKIHTIRDTYIQTNSQAHCYMVDLQFPLKQGNRQRKREK